MKTFSNHSKFVTSVTSDLELTKNELVTHIHRDLTSALWHLPRRVSRRKVPSAPRETFRRDRKRVFERSALSPASL